MKTIFVPIDFSSETETLLHHAKIMAKAYQSQIVLMHVSIPERQFNILDKPLDEERKELADQLRKEHRALQEYAQKLKDIGISAKGILVQGIPEEEIIEEAKDHDADLIIMGSHGQGRLFEMLVGSTCTGVLKNTDIPVLVIPSKKGETK